MNINQLISIVKNKIEKNISLEYINIEDKTFVHKKHKTHQSGKFHLKLSIKYSESEKINKIDFKAFTAGKSKTDNHKKILFYCKAK